MALAVLQIWPGTAVLDPGNWIASFHPKGKLAPQFPAAEIHRLPAGMNRAEVSNIDAAMVLLSNGVAAVAFDNPVSSGCSNGGAYRILGWTDARCTADGTGLLLAALTPGEQLLHGGLLEVGRCRRGAITVVRALYRNEWLRNGIIQIPDASRGTQEEYDVEFHDVDTLRPGQLL